MFNYIHAYITVDLNLADWAASVAQLAEHWTSNPVVTGSNPVQGSSVFFSLSAFGLCLTYFPSLLTFPCAYTCTRLIMYMYMYVSTQIVIACMQILTFLLVAGSNRAQSTTTFFPRAILPSSAALAFSASCEGEGKKGKSSTCNHTII